MSENKNRLKRNLIVHAGFLVDFIELRKENEVLFVKIGEECLNILFDLLDMVFKEDLRK